MTATTSAESDADSQRSSPLPHSHRISSQHELRTNDAVDAIRTTIARPCNLEPHDPCTVHSMPPELLIRIFTAVSDISDPRASHSLMAVTHVCHNWRVIALDVPELWSSIVVTSLSYDGVYAFVARARDHALLDIRLQNPVDLRLLRDFQRRLRSLIVVANNLESLAQVVKQLSWGRSPHLETLSLLGPEVARLSGTRLAFDTLPVLDEDEPQIKPSLTPALRCLHLRPMVFPWTSSIYSKLAVLDIDTTRNSSRLTEGRLLSILGRCPELVELRLRVEGDLIGLRVLPRDGSRDVRVALPRLSIFSVDGLSPEVFLGLLSQLTLPAFTRYDISLRSTSRPGSVVAVFPRDLLHLPGLTAVKSLRLEDVGGHNIHVIMYPSGSHPVTLTLANEPNGLKIPFVPTTVLESLETFTLIGSPASPEHFLDWRAIFCRAPLLRVLRLVRPHGEDIAHALEGLARPAGVQQPSTGLPCPKLERLELIDVSFNAQLEEHVLQVVRERVKSGHALQELEVRSAVGASSGFLLRLRDELDIHVVSDSS